MVSPCLFKAMCEKVNGLCTFWSQDQESGGSSAESANQPKNIFHRSVSSSLSFLLTGWMQQKGALFVRFVCLIFQEGSREHERKQLHFGDGFGSFRSCAWYRSPCSSKDAGDCGGCCDSPQSFCSSCQDNKNNDASERGFDGSTIRRDEGQSVGRSTWAAGCANNSTGKANREGIEARGQTLWRGGVGSVRQAFGRPMAGGDGSFLWDLCRIRRGRYVEDGDES